MHDDLGIAAHFIAGFERLHKVLPSGMVAAYPDPNWGWKVPTIGWGTTRYNDGAKVGKSDVITKEKAAYELVMFLHDKSLPVLQKRIPTWSQTTANQRAAWLSFSYNLGNYWYGHKNFTSMTRLADTPERWGDKEYVQSTFVKYRSPGSPSESGLRKRRIAESELFMKEAEHG